MTGPIALNMPAKKLLLWLVTLLVLVPKIMIGAETTNSPALSFQPEVERVLDGNGVLGARVYLDFESGQVTVERLPEDPGRDRHWQRDLKLDLTPGSEEWTGVDLQVAPASEELWNAPADKVIAALADNLAPPLPTMQVTPGVWFFKTDRGRYGLMRVVGFVEPHPGCKAMKIVYKLTAETPATK
jgi:hypothetical protein